MRGLGTQHTGGLMICPGATAESEAAKDATERRSHE